MSQFPFSFNRHVLADYYMGSAICLECGRVIHWNRVWKGEELIPICPGKIQPPYRMPDIPFECVFSGYLNPHSNISRSSERQ